MSRLIDPIARARTFAARRGGMADNAKLRKRVSRIERALSPLRSDRDTADDFTSFMDEVDEPPEASDETVGRVYLIRNNTADDVLNVGITAADGTPILVGLSTVSTGTALKFLWTSQITGLTSVAGVALDASGNIHSIDSGTGTKRLRKYNSSLVLQWTTLLGTGHQHAATDGTSDFVTRSTSGAPLVEKFLASTGVLGSPTSFGSGGTGNGQFGSGGPIGICFDGTNTWVVDTGNNRVQKFTASTGAYVSQFDGSSSGTAFVAPTGIFLTSTHLYVLDAPNGRVVKFDKATHAFVATFALGVGSADGQIDSTAEGIGVTSDGRIWIADTGNHRIQVFDSAGVFLGKTGTFGTGNGMFKSPKQLAVDSADRVWIADSGNGRLVTLAIDTGGITPTITERSGGATAVSATASATATATCSVGEVSIGGGANHGLTFDFNISESYRSGTTGWTVTMRNNTGNSRTFTPRVMCLKVPMP